MKRLTFIACLTIIALYANAQSYHICNSNGTTLEIPVKENSEITFDSEQQLIHFHNIGNIVHSFATSHIDSIATSKPVQSTSLTYLTEQDIKFDPADENIYSEVTETIVEDELLDEYGDFVEHYQNWCKRKKYAFNKSHATCYAWVSYQTGWLKAHYPAEFQAANLTKNLSNMEEIKKIMDDCKKNGIKVLNPDINESDARFTVNKQGEIRFGLGGIKGFGDNIVRAILAEREENGLFEDIYDFVERMSGVVNRKAFEALLFSGAFDSFGICRKQFTLPSKSGDTFLDTLLRYGELYRKDSMESAVSLFGEVEELKPERPEMPPMTSEDDILERLQMEKELVGMYLSSHPLDQYAFELENFTTCQIGDLEALISDCETKKIKQKTNIAGFIISVQHMTTKTGRPWSKTVIEDYSGSYEIALFGKDHEAFMSHMQLHNAIFIEGEIEEKYYIKPEDKAQGKTSPYAFKVKKVMLLGNVTDSFVKGFAISVSTPMLTPEFRDRLVNVIKRNKGNVPLTMFLYDPEKKWNIEFLSRKFRVAVTAPFIEELNRMQIRYSVLKK